MAEGIQVLEFEKPIVESEQRILELQETLRKSEESGQQSPDLVKEIKTLKKKCEKLKEETYASLTPAQRVQLARHPKRPYSLDYINLIIKDFVELHGDRNFGDDKAVITGFGTFENEPVCIIGQQKGRSLQENMNRNFGMMHPEGYRKAMRIMKMAEKFSKPVIVLIDTPGAYPGIGAEERGQSEAIASNLRDMSMLETQIICVVIGEGGSGGALGIGVGDRILMLENSYYSVITPEGCAAILFKDATKYAEAAEVLKITANDLYKLQVIDEVVKEPLGGAHKDLNITAENMKNSIKKHLIELNEIPAKKLVQKRYSKYREIGFTKE